MFRRLIYLLILTIFLSACNFPRPTQTASADQISTQVSNLLTRTPLVSGATSVFPQLQPSATPLVLSPITATSTLSQTINTSTPVPTAITGDPRASLGDPTGTDPMDKSYLFASNGDDTHHKTEFSNGALVMTSFNPDGWHSWLLSYIKLKNQYIEATFETGDCSGLDRYGLMVRSPDPTQGYLFGVSCDGQYSLRKWDGSSFTDLIKWTQSSNINSGSNQTNRLGIQISGDQFSLYVNGHLLGQTTDSSYSEGVFGIFQAASETSNFIIRVDELSYWNLE